MHTMNVQYSTCPLCIALITASILCVTRAWLSSLSGMSSTVASTSRTGNGHAKSPFIRTIELQCLRQIWQPQKINNKSLISVLQSLHDVCILVACLQASTIKPEHITGHTSLNSASAPTHSSMEMSSSDISWLSTCRNTKKNIST